MIALSLLETWFDAINRARGGFFGPYERAGRCRSLLYRYNLSHYTSSYGIMPRSRTRWLKYNTLFSFDRVQIQFSFPCRILWSLRRFQHGQTPLEASGVYREPDLGIGRSSVLRLRLQYVRFAGMKYILLSLLIIYNLKYISIVLFFKFYL